MNIVVHKANERGKADYGWLKSYHSFSFSSYYNPERMRFGALRVLNDDTVAPGMGFGTHPHDNMEIISIPLSGDLKHRDSMGNEVVIRQGDIQVMSAGTGITHSEMNAHADREVKFLQIWILPDERNVAPRYDQRTLDQTKMKNRLLQVAGPDEQDHAVRMHQQAWFYMGNLEAGTSLTYQLHQPDHGVYAFLLEGDCNIQEQHLTNRDGIGITGIASLEIHAIKNSSLLLMEVPMY